MFEADQTWELVLCIGDTVGEEAVLMGARMAMIGELLNRRIAEVEADDDDPGYMLVTGFSRTTAEVGAAMHLAPRDASRMVSQAESLTNRLPNVAHVLRLGRVDWASVQAIIAHTDLITDDTILARVDTELAGRIHNWTSWSRRRVINAVDALVKDLDPDAITQREQAETRRYLRLRPGPDGTTRLDGVLTTRAGAAFDQRLHHIATSVCPEDPRTLDQRRADAIEALAENTTLRCQCGRPQCPQTTATNGPATPGVTALGPSALRVVFNVITPESTLLGGTAPGYLTGYGVIDAAQVRELAAEATLRVMQAPDITRADALRYQPSAALARWIRCRDVTCRFPGCDRPAEHCDIDHTIPFDHRHPENGGLTVPWNLKCLCRQHHRLKTFHDRWHDQQLPDGTILWTAPSGHTYRTSPGAAELFAHEGRPHRRPHRHTPTPRHVSIARKRAKNARLRPTNAEARRIKAARSKEMWGRRERNRQRATLTLFKGDDLSHSLYARWVNEPPEPENLPTTWQPPPPPGPGPDDPPF